MFRYNYFFFALKSLVIFIFHFFDAKLTRDLKVSTSSKLFKIYINKDYLFHSTNNPIILGRNISSEVNITVAHIKSFLLIVKRNYSIIANLFFTTFCKLKNYFSYFFNFCRFWVYLFKNFWKKLKQKSEIAFHERV